MIHVHLETMCILQLLGMVLIYMSILFVGLFTYLLIYFLICSINEPKPESGFLKLRMKLKDVSQTEEYKIMKNLSYISKPQKAFDWDYSQNTNTYTHTHTPIQHTPISHDIFPFLI